MTVMFDENRHGVNEWPYFRATLSFEKVGKIMTCLVDPKKPSRYEDPSVTVRTGHEICQ